MKHLEFTPTPVNILPYYSEKLGCKLLCKRDDLFAAAGGGSKARMLQYILADVNRQNCDVLVTAGGPCSNFNRACSLMCASLGIPMHLIEYTDNPDEWKSLNYYLCQLAGIKTTRCAKSVVPQTIKIVMDSYTQMGKIVKNVYGGGKSLEGIFAYYDAVKELSRQISDIDYVFLACGTGTTLTGICAGMQTFFPKAKVFAISIARRYEQEIPVLEDDMQILNSYSKQSYTFDNLVFLDKYLCGGYANYSIELFDSVRECISHEGMVVDPTYSGKALWGMINELRANPSRFAGKNVLFWNTGGIINLLSTKDDNKVK